MSDHNAVYAWVEVPWPPSYRGGAKSMRCIMRKTGKEYVVHVDKSTKKRYVMMKGARVYMTDLKGQFKYQAPSSPGPAKPRCKQPCPARSR